MNELPDRATFAAHMALVELMRHASSLSLSNATGAAVVISAARNRLKLSEVKEVVKVVREHVSPTALTIYSAVFDETLGDEMRVTVLATGMS
jgi:cell division protein FtsZ